MQIISPVTLICTRILSFSFIFTIPPFLWIISLVLLFLLFSLDESQVAQEILALKWKLQTFPMLISQGLFIEVLGSLFIVLDEQMKVDSDGFNSHSAGQ